MSLFSPNDPHQDAPFTTPEGYFEELPARIQRRITASPTPTSTPVGFPRWAYFSLAVVTLLVGLTWLITRVGTPPEGTTSADSRSAEQLLAEVSEEVLIDYLQTSDVDIMTTTPLTEAEQQVLLEQELSTYEITEDYFNETNDELLQELP